MSEDDGYFEGLKIFIRTDMPEREVWIVSGGSIERIVNVGESK